MTTVKSNGARAFIPNPLDCAAKMKLMSFVV